MARAEEPLTVTREQQLEWVRPMETPLFTSLHETIKTKQKQKTSNNNNNNGNNNNNMRFGLWY